MKDMENMDEMWWDMEVYGGMWKDMGWIWRDMGRIWADWKSTFSQHAIHIQSTFSTHSIHIQGHLGSDMAENIIPS